MCGRLGGGGLRRGWGVLVFMFVGQCFYYCLCMDIYGCMSACMLHVYLCMCVSRCIYTGSARSLKAFKRLGKME